MLDQVTRFQSDSAAPDAPFEVIVKYSGDIESVARALGAEAEILSVNYAIITLPLHSLQALYGYPEVEYVELPKNVTYVLQTNLNDACISSVQRPEAFGLTGQGVAAGIIDSGIDYTHPDFRNEDGTSRVLFLWDQTIEGSPPPGFHKGTLYTQQQLNEALASDVPFEKVPSRDTVGHGTAIAGIIAGNGRASAGKEKGAAPQATLIVVKLGVTGPTDFTRTTDIMRAAKFIYDTAQPLGMPLAVNLSYGSNDGSHEGNSLFESYMDSLATRWKSVICVASGNEGSAGHHFSGTVTQWQTLNVEVQIGPNLQSVYMTLWKNFADTMSFQLAAPSGRSTGNITILQSITRVVMDGVQANILFGQPNHYNGAQEIYFLLRGQSGVMPPGIWTISVNGLHIVDGRFDIWLPTVDEVGTQTAFLQPDPENTITIPATAQGVISVGGYNSLIGTSADFSGRGRPYNTFFQKPDLVAPAVSVLTTKSGGGYDTYTGTSMAAPFVTGSAVLMMEWAQIRGNDPFLYGQRLKAFLCRTARRTLPTHYPNSIWGYGTLSLCDAMNDLVDMNARGGAFR